MICREYVFNGVEYEPRACVLRCATASANGSLLPHCAFTPRDTPKILIGRTVCPSVPRGPPVQISIESPHDLSQPRRIISDQAHTSLPLQREHSVSITSDSCRYTIFCPFSFNFCFAIFIEKSPLLLCCLLLAKLMSGPLQYSNALTHITNSSACGPSSRSETEAYTHSMNLVPRISSGGVSLTNLVCHTFAQGFHKVQDGVESLLSS